MHASGLIVRDSSIVTSSWRAERSFTDFLGPVILSLGVVAVLVISQPDMGTVLIIGAGAFAVLIASRAPLGYIFGTGIAGALAAMGMAAVEPYRWERVTAFIAKTCARGVETALC